MAKKRPRAEARTALLKTSKPTASKAIDALRRAKVLHEITGKLRYRFYAYTAYLDLLSKDAAIERR
jgi:hypothetical protein